MKAVLDHIGIAVKDLDTALQFYRDALGLEIEAPEDVPTQQVRAHFVKLGRSSSEPAAGADPGASLELLQATAPESAIAKFIEKRGPGLHHITLRVDDIHAALAQLKARGARLVDNEPRPGAEGALVAFIHPSSAQGVLIELKQSAVGSRQSAVGSPQSAVGSPQSAVGSRQSAVGSPQSAVGSPQSAVGSPQSAVGSPQSAVGSPQSAVGSRQSAVGSPQSAVGSPQSAVGSPQSAVGSRQSAVGSRQSAVGSPQSAVGNQSAINNQQSAIQRYSLGDVELISVSDGFFRLDGGSMFGVIPKTMWSQKAPPDERNRIRLAMRPLIVRGARTMIIDAGMGDKESDKFHEIYGIERSRHLDHSLAEAGLAPEDIDIVLASHLHFDHAGGFTVRDAGGRIRPRFPRAQYVVRRGEWEDATHPSVRTRASYLLDNYLPLAEAGVLQLVDDDLTIMPGVRVRRTGGHTQHHQMILIESGGKTAAFVADLIPTTAHVPDVWVMGYDLYPLDTMAAKQQFTKEAIEKKILVFFEHDPVVAAGYLTEEKGKRGVVTAPG